MDPEHGLYVGVCGSTAESALSFLHKHPIVSCTPQQMLSAGGRVFLGDLQPVLNVDNFHIDQAAVELAQEVCIPDPTQSIHIHLLCCLPFTHPSPSAPHPWPQDPTLLLLNGELIASWHLDGLVEEANVALQDVGKVGPPWPAWDFSSAPCSFFHPPSAMIFPPPLNNNNNSWAWLCWRRNSICPSRSSRRPSRTGWALGC